MNWTDIADILRFGLVAIWIINLILTGMTVFFYALRVSEMQEDEKGHHPPRMMRHIGFIGASYTLFSTSAVVGSFLNLGQPPTWRLWLNLAAAILGFFALLAVTFHERDHADL